MSGQEQIEPIPNYGEIDESELKQVSFRNEQSKKKKKKKMYIKK